MNIYTIRTEHCIHTQYNRDEETEEEAERVGEKYYINMYSKIMFLVAFLFHAHGF